MSNKLCKWCAGVGEVFHMRAMNVGDDCAMLSTCGHCRGSGLEPESTQIKNVARSAMEAAIKAIKPPEDQF